MKLFLCSHFSSVGSLIKEEIENKKVAFIPTASLREGYTGYVGSARKLFMICDIVGKAPQGKATGDKNERNEVAYSVFTDNAVFLSVVLHGSYFFGWD